MNTKKIILLTLFFSINLSNLHARSVRHIRNYYFALAERHERGITGQLIAGNAGIWMGIPMAIGFKNYGLESTEGILAVGNQLLLTSGLWYGTFRNGHRFYNKLIETSNLQVKRFLELNDPLIQQHEKNIIRMEYEDQYNSNWERYLRATSKNARGFFEDLKVQEVLSVTSKKD